MGMLPKKLYAPIWLPFKNSLALKLYYVFDHFFFRNIIHVAQILDRNVIVSFKRGDDLKSEGHSVYLSYKRIVAPNGFGRPRLLARERR